jgi:hypothetical protein
MSLGPSTVLTCEQARTRAIASSRPPGTGDDLAAKRDADRQDITVKELAERFDKEHVAVRSRRAPPRGIVAC